MTQLQCPQGHVYIVSPGQSQECPHCATMNDEQAKTRGMYDAQPTNAPDFPGFGSHDATKTIGTYDHLTTEVDPVVGWLACINGPDRGRDWRLVAGRNAIGRSKGMPVSLFGDNAISRERHAIVSFEPRRKIFSLLPGESRGLVYLNGEEVVSPVTLKAYDRIELGKSVLLFVPLSGPNFSWPDEAV